MKTLLFCLLLTGSLLADEVVKSLTIDGQRYESVKWGTVNQGKIVISHSRGVAIIPLEKLPAEYQAKFGYKPAPPPAQSDPQQILKTMRAKRSETSQKSQTADDWTVYTHDRVSKVVLDGKLVDKSSLTTLTGFLTRENAQITAGVQTAHGAVIDIAARREDVEAVASAMELRPTLWKPTGEQVLLLNYQPETIAGGLIRVYIAEAEPVKGHRVFKVGTEPSFEQWQALTSR